ncbi:TPA: fimbrial protein [Proteus mirabilis]|uniref:fimbrial protein n=1 Tax=Proteus mirabilis TaxID=584 RepID=UPI0034D72654
MRKLRIFYYMIGFFLLLSSFFSFSDNLKIHGSLINTPCKVLPEDAQLEVDFGEIQLSDIYNNNPQIERKSFKINLSECDPSIAQQVKVKFDGKPHAKLLGLLALDESANNPELGIEITTKEGNPITLGEFSKLYNITHTGDIELNFGANLQSTPKGIADKTINPGYFTAKAIFSLKYE